MDSGRGLGHHPSCLRIPLNPGIWPAPFNPPPQTRRSDETTEKPECMAHSNPVRRHEFPPLAGCHHPALAFREPFFPVAKAPDRTRLGPLAFDRQYRLPPVGDNEVHLAPSRRSRCTRRIPESFTRERRRASSEAPTGVPASGRTDGNGPTGPGRWSSIRKPIHRPSTTGGRAACSRRPTEECGGR